MTLTVSSALALINSAIRAGEQTGTSIAVSIVDLGGRVIAAARSERAGFINMDASRRKAVAAVNFKAPTQAVSEMIKADAFLLQAVLQEAEICVIPGGFPLTIDGELVGAMGIAGGHYSQDQMIGERALEALQVS